MLSPQALIRVIVQRALSSLNADNTNIDVGARAWSRGELASMPVVRKAHVLADEGSYYLANNNQTGIATGTPAAFSATAPFLVIENHNAPASGLRCYLDYLALVTTAAGGWASGGVNIQLVAAIDVGVFRYSSGGSQITNINNANTEVGNGTGNIAVYAGAITATAASAAVRNVVGLRTLRPAVSTTVADVIGELKVLNFGGVEAMLNGAITVASANMISHPMPPLVIGPGSSALIYLILNGTTPSAASYAPELGYWVR